MTQNPTTFALKGAVCFSTDSRHLTCLEDAYLVCQDGRSVGVFPKLPEHFSGIPVRNVSPCLIIPGMTDLHLHAPAIDPLAEQHQPHVMHIFSLERLQTEDIVHDAEIQPFFSGKAANERKI